MEEDQFSEKKSTFTNKDYASKKSKQKSHCTDTNKKVVSCKTIKKHPKKKKKRQESVVSNEHQSFASEGFKKKSSTGSKFKENTKTKNEDCKPLKEKAGYIAHDEEKARKYLHKQFLEHSKKNRQFPPNLQEAEACLNNDQKVMEKSSTKVDKGRKRNISEKQSASKIVKRSDRLSCTPGNEHCDSSHKISHPVCGTSSMASSSLYEAKSSSLQTWDVAKNHRRSSAGSSFNKSRKSKTNLGWLRRRPWSEVSDCKYTDHSAGHKGLLFSVASYNVLAQDLLQKNRFLYERNNPKHLKWKYRSENLLQEIRDLQPDLLCLQEVNSVHFETFFKPELSKLGYKGQYKKRTRDMKDGCATFWKTEKWMLEKAVPIEYYNKRSTLLDRDNIALLLLLKHTTDGSKLCVANTHILFNPKRGDVKLAQSMLLLTEIDKLAFCQMRNHETQHYPIILCGDFNCEPFSELYNFYRNGVLNCRDVNRSTLSGQLKFQTFHNGLTKELLPKCLNISDKCKYIDCIIKRLKVLDDAVYTTGSVLLSNPELHSHQNDQMEYCSQHEMQSASEAFESLSECLSKQLVTCKTVIPKIKQNSGKVSHELNLLSVYTHSWYQGRDQKREVTTYFHEASLTCDYIFYNKSKHSRRDQHPRAKASPGGLRLISRLALPTSDYMQYYGYLPNRQVSSDHVILMAKFLLT